MTRNRTDREDGTTPDATRRTLLATVGTGFAAVAGCLGAGDDGDDAVEDVDDDFVLDGVVLDDSIPIEVIDPRTREILLFLHHHDDEAFTHWHGIPLEIPAGEWYSVEVVITDSSRERLPLGPDATYQVGLQPTDDTPAGWLEVDVTGGVLDLFAEHSGQESADLFLHRDGTRVWEPPRLDIRARDS